MDNAGSFAIGNRYMEAQSDYSSLNQMPSNVVSASR
ncbi:MAG: hypothetical protein ACI9XU_001639, partial [Arenicella sp.]